MTQPKCYIRSSLVFSEMSRDTRDELKQLLSVPNPKYQQIKRFSPYGSTKEPTHLFGFREVGKAISVPRGTPFGKLSDAAKQEIRGFEFVDQRMNCPVDYPAIDFQLTEQQLLAKQRFEEKMDSSITGCFLLELPVSSGKTRLATALAALTGQRTLVLCKTGLIMDAWKKELLLLFGDQLSVGVIKQKKFTPGGHITLASWQTMNRRQTQWQSICDLHGCLIVDECHAVVPPVFSQFVRNFHGKYKFGLTGTINRPDGLGPMILWEFGRPTLTTGFTDMASNTRMNVTDVIEVGTHLEFETPRGELFDFHGYMEKCISDPARNELIVSNVVKEFSLGHRPLVVTSRVNHALELERMLGERIGADNVTLCIGGNSQKEVENLVARCMSHGVVVATLSFINEGANIPPLDRLFLTTTIKSSLSLEQVIGRIRRAHPGKEDCIIYDFVDWKIRTVRNHFVKHRVPIYKKLGVAKYENKIFA